MQNDGVVIHLRVVHDRSGYSIELNAHHIIRFSTELVAEATGLNIYKALMASGIAAQCEWRMPRPKK